jgi:ubiquinone/menaquinone biosynthesis C-methylase UbiE
MSKDIVHRFSDRVDNYIKHRPHYPEEVYDFLETEKILFKDCIIADIGSGTGISAEPLLKRNYFVYCIEPNREMRKAAENLLQSCEKFKSIEATAENTTLTDASIDTILVAQAFHWFDKIRAHAEFKRILKPSGNAVLVWNDRQTNTSDFLKVYEDFLQMFAIDYKEVDHKKTQDRKVFDVFFSAHAYSEKIFYNFQDVDFAGLKGRVLSSSYMPNEGHVDFDFMISCLKKIFMRYQQNGTVRLAYDTKLYYGPLN